MFKVITYLNLIVFHTSDVAEQISDLGFKANCKFKAQKIIGILTHRKGTPVRRMYYFISHQFRVSYLIIVAISLRTDMKCLPMLIKVMSRNLHTTKSALFSLIIISFTTVILV